MYLSMYSISKLKLNVLLELEILGTVEVENMQQYHWNYMHQTYNI